MVTQKMISVRIDLIVLDMLDKEVAAIGISRNMLINRCARDYIMLLNIIRRAKSKGENTMESQDLKDYIEMVEKKKTVTWRI